MNHPLRLGLPALSLVLLSGCGGDEWEGFVYPSAADLTVHTNIGIFESLESCRAAALDELDAVSSRSRGDYECGLNCRDDSRFPSMKICDETVR